MNHVAAVKQPVRCKLQIFLHFKIRIGSQNLHCPLPPEDDVRILILALASDFPASSTLLNPGFFPISQSEGGSLHRCVASSSQQTRGNIRFVFVFRISSRLNIPDYSAFEIRKKGCCKRRLAISCEQTSGKSGFFMNSKQSEDSGSCQGGSGVSLFRDK